VSKWTYLCETLPVEIFINRFDAHVFNLVKTEFLENIEDKLRKPLSIADRKGLDKKSETARYLEENKLNISDLLIYFFIKIFEKLFRLNLTSYDSTKNWYDRLEHAHCRLLNLHIVIDCFLSGSSVDDDFISLKFQKINVCEKKVMCDYL
jgi:hypothetical protein